MSDQSEPREWKIRIDKLYDCSLRMTPVSDDDVEVVVLKAAYDKLREELASARQENEELMRDDYWQSRHKAAVAKLTLAREALEGIKSEGHDDRCPQGNGKGDMACVCSCGKAEEALKDIE